MGVIHKLKQEVVDYVLLQKEINPNLSCRKLVDVVYQKFQIGLSKSSINTILKQAEMSSPVGRRPGFRPPGEAPERSSQQPAQPPQRTAGPADSPNEPAKPPTPDRPIAKKSPKLPKPARQQVPPPIKKALQPPKKSLSAQIKLDSMPDLPGKPKTPAKRPEEPLVEAQSKSLPADDFSLEKAAPDRGILYDGMGNIFLKAAEWELSDKSLLGELLRKHLKGGLLLDLDTAGEILVLLPAFGINRLEDLELYNRPGLWALCGVKTRIDASSLHNVIHEVSDLRDLRLALDVEIPQIFTEISFIKLVLENGSAIWMDTQMTSVWPTGSARLPLYSSMNKVLSLIAKKFLHNEQPVILCGIPDLKEPQKAFFDLICAFENVPEKRLKHIAVYDVENTELANFDTIPEKKRHLIAAAWPWQPLYKQLAELQKQGGKESKSGKIAQKLAYFGEKELICSEMTVALPKELLSHQGSVKLRVIFVKESAEDKPLVILLTNISEKEQSALEIVRKYNERWPNLQNGFNLFMLKNQAPLEAKFREMVITQPGLSGETNSYDLSTYDETSYDFVKIANKVTTYLNLFCQKSFFPAGYEKIDINVMISRFYGLAGYLSVNPERIQVEFVLPECNYLYHKDLEFAITRVNESDIRDFSGRLLKLGIFIK